MNFPPRSALAACMTPALLMLTSSDAPAQQRTTFSIEGRGGPASSTVPCGGGPTIEEADLLQPKNAERIPELAADTPVCVGRRGGGGVNTLGLPAYPGVAEVDALSYGNDARIQAVMPAGSYMVSVDKFAVGHPFASPLFPSVQTESIAAEASAGAYTDTGIPMVPYPFGAGPIPNVQCVDGDGYDSANGFTTPGLGLVEPNPVGVPPDLGDNVDAMDLDGPSLGDFVLFSLDGALFDPCAGVNGTNSAVVNGYLPSQVLASDFSGAAPIVWISAAQLGLGPVDDLDALAVWDDGNRVYDPADAPFLWNNGAADMVLFSVRRGSPVIGQADSFFGAPIEEGDILMPPVAGGFSNFPAIVVPGEAMGLATRRSGTARLCGGNLFADDVDALDVCDAPLFDCNGNGSEDALDIALLGDCDVNKNGVLDYCELANYCTAGTSASGCQALIAASGVASASMPSGFFLSAVSVEGNKPGTFFFGSNGRQASAWGNGTSFQCVVPPVSRTGPLPAVGTNGLCDGAFNQDLNALWTAQPAKNPGAGAVVQAQLWYRDPSNTSNRSTSFSGAIEFLVCP